MSNIIKYPNQAGKITGEFPDNTNLFESTIGMLNIAPLKISGQYKIVIDLNLNLWLDNYCGRRVAIDMTNAFLPQVSNFISTETDIIDLRILRYGGHNSTIDNETGISTNYWHIPLYLGASKETYNFEYPKYFVLTKQPNENITEVSTVFQNGLIEQIIDLERIGLYKIFDEIYSEEYFEAPIWFNWEESKLILFGQGINPARPVKQTIEIFDIQANQPYFDVFNNKILNFYQKYQMFFPKFLNLEFEFDVPHNKTFQFNNYFGYLSNCRTNAFGNPLEIDVDNKIYSKLKSLDSGLTFNPYKGYELKLLLEDPAFDFKFEKYFVKHGSFYIQEVNTQVPQISFIVSDISVNDILKIYDMDSTIVFEYHVSVTDIDKTSLYRTIINIINRCNKQSDKQFHFSLATTDNPDNSSFTIICQNRSTSDFDEDYYVQFPSTWVTVDRFEDSLVNRNFFRGITDKDAWCVNQQRVSQTNNYRVVLDDNRELRITEYFYYNELLIIRFDQAPNITKLTQVQILEEQSEELIETTPILLYATYSQVPTFSQFNQDSYCDSLLKHFKENWNSEKHNFMDYEIIVNRFRNRIKTSGDPLYVKENIESKDLDAWNVIDINNQQIVNKHGNTQLTMMFSTIGQTTHFSPNLLNVHYQNYIQSGNLDFEKPNDQYQFYWFLIHGITPEYHKGTISELRYFWEDELGHPEQPKVTSRVIASLDRRNAETIFLGVKYQLPIDYVGYDFAVYLNPNNLNDIDLSYNFKVDILQKTLYLEINKYIDFGDLIRGMGKNTDNPMLDLSFFYSVRESFTETSDFLYQSIKAGFIIGENVKETEGIIFDGAEYSGKWYAKSKFDGKWYFCIKRNQLFPNTEFDGLEIGKPMPTVFIYGSIWHKGPDGIEKEYHYRSVSIDILNIKEATPDYIWAEDIQIKFFDTSTIFLNIYNQITGVYEIFQINRETNHLQIIDVVNPDGFYPEYEKNATAIIDNQTVHLQLIAPDVKLSLKEYYFDYIVTSKPNHLNNNVQTNSAFYFDEFFLLKAGLSPEQILNKLETHVDLFKIYREEKIAFQEDSIDLFARNQIWKLIQDLLTTQINIKSLDESQIRYVLSDFNIMSLIDYCKVHSVPINYGSEYIKINPIQIDKNVTIWKLLKTNGINTQNADKLYLIDRPKTKYLPYFPLIADIKDFQIEPFKYNGTIFNIFDNRFGNLMLGDGPGYNERAIPVQLGDKDINAVTLWNINSNLGLPNIISSLFSLSDNLKITTKTTGNVNLPQQVNYFELFRTSEYVNYDNIKIVNPAIIGHTGDNADYIQLFDNNLIPYITKQYTEFIFTYYYQLSEVLNEFGERLDYTVDSFNKYILHFKPQIQYRADYKSLIFVFKRY